MYRSAVRAIIGSSNYLAFARGTIPRLRWRSPVFSNLLAYKSVVLAILMVVPSFAWVIYMAPALADIAKKGEPCGSSF